MHISEYLFVSERVRNALILRADDLMFIINTNHKYHHHHTIQIYQLNLCCNFNQLQGLGFLHRAEKEK